MADAVNGTNINDNKRSYKSIRGLHTDSESRPIHSDDARNSSEERTFAEPLFKVPHLCQSIIYIKKHLAQYGTK
ncbi:hypothetical protein SNE40_013128 [Patella caerulea]|uniref:Uncharacterized protein n=1 Tax=Patella caerulea TaxID=87958 RepID=A0AAN8JMI2_PATCE